MKLFVSYRSTDSKKVDPIVARLRSLKYDVWQDKDCIPPGQDWWEAICEGIDACDIFLFMVSRKSVKSSACLAELSYAYRLNLPIIPFVLEGEWVYQENGKHNIAFWNDIPSELQDDDNRNQFLFYEGASFVEALERGINKILEKNLPRFPTDPPPDPRYATDASNNATVIYDDAYDFAHRGELDTAEKLFRKLVIRNDKDYGARSHTWITLIREYQRIKEMAERKSTRKIAHNLWNDYIQKFPKDFLKDIFDPDNIPQYFASEPQQPRSTRTVPLNKHTSISLLSKPFDWVEIPAGSGKMKTDEVNVILQIPTERYWIAKYPITNEQFKLFVDAGGYKERRWWTDEGWEAREEGWHYDGGWQASGIPWAGPRYWQDDKWNGADQPVVGVSWYEAVAFCLWLSETTGENIMLPTEDQWQYAAQGDDGRTYPWGNEWGCKRCNNSVKPCDSNVTTPVTQYEGKAMGDSPFSVVDMAGNVWEWCLTDYNTGDDDVKQSTDRRVLRGGSWYFFNALVFRCDHRNKGNPHFWGDRWGFRIVRNASP